MTALAAKETAAGISPVATARIFARLKVVLLLRTLARGGVWSVIAFSVSLLAAFGMAVFGVVAALTIQPVVGTSLDLAIAVASIVGALAVLGPLIGGGVDDTIAPAKLALLPLETPSLIAGSAVAALIGPWPLAGLTVVVAATIRAVDGSAVAAIVAPVAVVLTTAAFVSLSRTAIVGLTTLLRRRVVSEIAALLTVALALGGWALSRFGGEWFSDRLDVVGAIAGWTPLGLPTAAVGDLAAGRWAFGLLRFALALGMVVALLACWDVLTQRALTTAETAGRTRRIRVGRRPSRPAVLAGFLPERPWAAVASRVLHEIRRNPRRRVALIMACLPGVFIAAITIFSGARRATDIFIVAVIAVFLASGAQNMFGIDGSALWADVVSGDRMRAVVFGYTAAIAIVSAPIVVVATVALAFATSTASSLPSAVIVGLAALGGALGMFAAVSSVVPAAIPEEPTNAWTAKDAGKGCLTGVANLGATAAAIALALPPMLAGWAAWRSPVYAIVLLPLALAWGACGWWAGVWFATRRIRGREPELLAAITLGRE